MSTNEGEIAEVKAMINNLEDKISRLENRIEAAERDGRSEEYILSLRSELIELRKKDNILLGNFKQVVAVGKLSDIPSYLNLFIDFIMHLPRKPLCYFYHLIYYFI
jgi:hypothetical protein